jgi:hypothetical protein
MIKLKIFNKIIRLIIRGSILETMHPVIASTYLEIYKYYKKISVIMYYYPFH